MPEAQEHEPSQPVEAIPPQQQKLPLDLNGSPARPEPAKAAAPYPLKPKTTPFRRPAPAADPVPAAPAAAAERPEPAVKTATTAVRFTCGHLLKDAREKMQLSTVQLSQKTKISKEFIEQIEANQVEDLPPPVYAKSYLRQLCREFSLDPAPFLDDYARALENEPAEDSGSQFIVTSEPNETGAKVGYRPRSQVETTPNMKKMSPSMIAVSIVVAALVVLVLIAVIMNQTRQGRSEATGTVAAGKVDANINLESFITPQQLPLKELPVPGK